MCGRHTPPDQEANNPPPRPRDRHPPDPEADTIPSGRTQVLYKAHVLYCALFSRSCFFFSLEIAKKCFFVLYFVKNVLYFCKLFKWVEYLFQVFIYNTKIGEL